MDKTHAFRQLRKDTFISVLATAGTRHLRCWSGVLLFNWSQMPNHIHFNVQTPDGNLAEFMQRMLTRFAKRFNRCHRLVGHVFQGRYGARLIDQENHFQEIARYVELNPYRTKKKEKLAELGAWKWSSLRHYMSPEDQWPEGCRTAFRRVLERFGKDPVIARKKLAVFLADGLKEGCWEKFYHVKDRRFVGSEAFVERIKQQSGESGGPGQGKARQPVASGVDVCGAAVLSSAAGPVGRDPGPE